MTRQRNYMAVVDSVRNVMRPDLDVAGRMRIVVDAIWDALGTKGISWVGFYLDQPMEPDDRRLVLGPCRNKPACSPIGLHGMCGKALLSKRTCIVDDVRHLGAAYIACDPRDQSEIVVPLVGGSGQCYAVLDLDSWEMASFDERDRAGLEDVLRAAGLVE